MIVTSGTGIYFVLLILVLVIPVAFVLFVAAKLIGQRLLAVKSTTRPSRTIWQNYIIPYNAVMAISGGAGMFFIYVNIPLLYLLAAVFFNLAYSLLAVIDRLTNKGNKVRRSKIIILSYSVVSVFVVLFCPMFLLLYLSLN